MANQNARTAKGRDAKLHIGFLAINLCLPQFFRFDLLLLTEALRKLTNINPCSTNQTTIFGFPVVTYCFKLL